MDFSLIKQKGGMKLFSKLYSTMIGWAGHRFATFYLALVSFIEASFFPIPPDIMLAPMVMAKREQWLRLALITTFFSVLGGLLGYLIGAFAFDFIGVRIIDALSLHAGYEKVVGLFDKWGIAMIFVAGLTPIPYKLFTIAAGVAFMPLLPFMLGSLVGRSCRFLLVSLLVYKLGPRFEAQFLHKLDLIGWISVGVIVLGICLLQIF